MKHISNIAGGPGQPCSEGEREKLVRDGAMHDAQGEITQKPGFQKGHAKMGGRTRSQPALSNNVPDTRKRERGNRSLLSFTLHIAIRNRSCS
jgi:hypothetical protein